MHNDYKDITSKLGKPLWWDEEAVPRYCEFSPDEIANIYAVEAVLALIACQDCGTIFPVAFSTSGYSRYDYKEIHLYHTIEERMLHYGDPPNYGCCGAGPSMNCDDIVVLEYWEKNKETDYDWKRNPKYETGLGEYTIYEDQIHHLRS
jgi:hypothetical protein